MGTHEHVWKAITVGCENCGAHKRMCEDTECEVTQLVDEKGTILKVYDRRVEERREIA